MKVQTVDFFLHGLPWPPQRPYLSSFIKYNITRAHSFNDEVNRASESDLATIWRRRLDLINTHFAEAGTAESWILLDFRDL